MTVLLLFMLSKVTTKQNVPGNKETADSDGRKTLVNEVSLGSGQGLFFRDTFSTLFPELHPSLLPLPSQGEGSPPGSGLHEYVFQAGI